MLKADIGLSGHQEVDIGTSEYHGQNPNPISRYPDILCLISGCPDSRI